jgi:hypothetical protein
MVYRGAIYSAWVTKPEVLEIPHEDMESLLERIRPSPERPDPVVEDCGGSSSPACWIVCSRSNRRCHHCARRKKTIRRAVELFLPDERLEGMTDQVAEKYKRGLDRFGQLMAKRSRFLSHEITAGGLTEFRPEQWGWKCALGIMCSWKSALQQRASRAMPRAWAESTRK